MAGMVGVAPKNCDLWVGHIFPGSIGKTCEISRSDLELITQKRKIKGYSEIERVTNNGEIMIYGLDGGDSILPSEVERSFEVSLTRSEIIESISGENLPSIASPEIITSAKTDIMVAIAEIAKRENVLLTEEEKEKLANFSVYLLKKLGSVV
ncbi:MAG: hypothetical protein NTX42_10340 [Methanothrix sp.]|nr:hypothetical protein [Methanothrix sp.]